MQYRYFNLKKWLLVIVSLLLSLLALTVVVLVGIFYWFSYDLPSYEELKYYEAPIMTHIYDQKGDIVGQYAKEKRIFLPHQYIPELVKQAFISAEDKNFYEHKGVDYLGVVRAMLVNISNMGQNRPSQGASTITQQLIKNFILSSEQSYERKIKEMILAFRFENLFSKERILELYLNDIYLGMGAYGIAQGAKLYFKKNINELSVAEIAYLAILPKAPNNYHPIRHYEKALARRNWVLERMFEDGYISEATKEEAQKTPIQVIIENKTLTHNQYFLEEVRRQLFDRFGEDTLYQKGMFVRTTLRSDIQDLAERFLRASLLDYDMEYSGYNPINMFNKKPFPQVDITANESSIRNSLSEVPVIADIPSWKVAYLTKVEDKQLSLKVMDSNGFKEGIVEIDTSKWVIPQHQGSRLVSANYLKSFKSLFKVGQVIYVESFADALNFFNRTNTQWRARKDLQNLIAVSKSGKNTANLYVYRQIPELNGAVVAMEPQSGKVLAIQGGFSFYISKFNRAIQAKRQPGSSFKPFVYLTALDSGFTPNSIIYDVPFVLDQGQAGFWEPKNDNGKFDGPLPLRRGLELSKNLMTIRIAQSVGMNKISDFVKRLGVYDFNSTLYLSSSIGANETTLLKMATAYASFAYNGKRINPYFVEKIQDRYGRNILMNSYLDCQGCEVVKSEVIPRITDLREDIIPANVNYQLVSLLQGAVQRGTSRSLNSLNIPLAGKTGTTNDTKDAWFIGFTPDILIGVYIGYDYPAKSLGPDHYGGTLSLPVFGNIMSVLLPSLPKNPFIVPSDIEFLPVDMFTGRMTSKYNKNAILEAFKPQDFQNMDRVVEEGVLNSSDFETDFFDEDPSSEDNASESTSESTSQE